MNGNGNPEVELGLLNGVLRIVSRYPIMIRFFAPMMEAGRGAFLVRFRQCR